MSAADDPALLRLADGVLQPGFDGLTAPDWVRRRLADGLGSVLLFGRNFAPPPGGRAQAAALVGQLRAEHPDILVAVDEEGGDVTRLEWATGSSYPGNLALGTVDDEDLTRAVARSIGRDLAALGIDLDYAPDADVNSDPRNPVIGVRSFGADPALVARHTAAWVRGLQEGGAAACAKHFPGHGDTVVDSHLGLPTVTADLAELERVALPPFRAATAAGARAVMTAHLLLPALDPEHPATVSPRVLTGLLRERLGFDGLVVTDAVEMRAVADRYGHAGAAVRALAAGADLVCLGDRGSAAEYDALRSAVARAVRTGDLPEERLAEAAARVAAFARWARDLRAAARGGRRTAPTREPLVRGERRTSVGRSGVRPGTARGCRSRRSRRTCRSPAGGWRRAVPSRKAARSTPAARNSACSRPAAPWRWPGPPASRRRAGAGPASPSSGRRRPSRWARSPPGAWRSRWPRSCRAPRCGRWARRRRRTTRPGRWPGSAPRPKAVRWCWWCGTRTGTPGRTRRSPPCSPGGRTPWWSSSACRSRRPGADSTWRRTARRGCAPRPRRRRWPRTWAADRRSETFRCTARVGNRHCAPAVADQWGPRRRTRHRVRRRWPIPTCGEAN
ncbi:glycoside hydrolase family 3 N-terminal domain-containing protein [Kitasatospora fiedleri]|nr:glycoside hydrolase family 3 N-terminal domain-containing protein [Kitasatospora fiedleri]